MPRFFFNLFDGEAILDTSGTEYPGLKEAQLSAINRAAVFLENRSHLWLSEEWSMEVRDEAQSILFTLRFSAGDLAAMLKVQDHQY